MSTSSPVAEKPLSVEAASVRIPLMTLVLAIMVAVLLSVMLLGGALFLGVRSGKFSLPKTEAAEAKPKVLSVAASTHMMLLEPIVANLADPNSTAYLKMTLSLRLVDDPLAKAPAEKDKATKGIGDTESEVRDTVLTVVGHQSSEQLLAPDGKERLKQAMKAALAAHNPEIKVADLYLIEFLVQR